MNFKFYDFKDTSKIDKLLEYTPVYLKRKHGDKLHAKNSEYLHKLKKYNPDVVLVCEFGLNTIIAILYKWIFRKNFKVVSICDDSYDM